MQLQECVKGGLAEPSILSMLGLEMQTMMTLTASLPI